MSIVGRLPGVLGRAYALAAAPFGSRALDRMRRRGLPSRLDAPLRFLFDGRVPEEKRSAAERIERRRAELAAQPHALRFAYHDSPLGMVRLAESGERAGDLPLHYFAVTASTSERWGMFLRLCAEAFEAQVVFEMGTCVGISTAYLAAASSRPRVITLEGSDALATIAQSTLDQLGIAGHSTIVRGPFEQTLPPALQSLGAPVDVAFIDGHHEEAATLHYVQAIEPYLSSPALFVLDDIHLYSGMWRAWRALVRMRGVAAAVNTGHFGLLLFDGRDAAPIEYDLSMYTGWWRVGGERKR